MASPEKPIDPSELGLDTLKEYEQILRDKIVTAQKDRSTKSMQERHAFFKAQQKVRKAIEQKKLDTLGKTPTVR